jgi:hypothetical protein
VTLANASGQGVDTFTAKVCDGTLPSGCALPSQIVSGPAASDASGTAELAVPLDRLAGAGLGTPTYVQLTMADGSTILYYPGHPFVGDQSFVVLTLDAVSARDFWSSVPGVDPSKSVVTVLPVFDCTGAGNPEGARILGPPGTLTFYAMVPAIGSGAAIDPSATGTFKQASPTFVANVDKGYPLIRAQPQPRYGDQYVASIAVEVRGGNSATVVSLYPSSL